MKTRTYRMSYTTGGLFYNESSLILSHFIQTHSWEDVQHEVLENNLLQLRTQSSIKRVAREIITRLKALTDEEINFFTDATSEEKKLLLWIAICRTYQFIKEFAVEVLKEKILTLNHTLESETYDAFFHAKAQWHKELDKQSESTKNKQRQVLFRILREVGIIDKSGSIMPMMISERLKSLLSHTARGDLYLLPSLEFSSPEMSDAN